MAARFTLSPVISQIWRQQPIQLPHQCGAACRYDPTVRLATDATARHDSNVVDGDWHEPARSCRCSYSAGQAVLGMALQSGGMREHHIGAGSIAVDSDNARLPPLLAAWAPNILFGTTALYFLFTLDT